ncbi:GAF domain-containing protein [Sporobolomyces salmoneus]|uniref:GAF domain-containing protein n=1 Tax=Sporobolomyces salmoneus TaxID=183962 RepID=UPI00316B6115
MQTSSPRQGSTRMREESNETSLGQSSQRTSFDSGRPSTAASTFPSSFNSPSPSTYPSPKATSFPHRAPPSSSTAQTSIEPSNLYSSESARHQNFDSTLSAGNRSSRSSYPAKSSFKKALAALGLSEKEKVRKPEKAPKPGPMESAREQGRRVLQYVKRKLNSKTPKEELPKTWEEYSKLYAAQQVDVDDPPLPPTQPDTVSEEPTPFEQRVWHAPRPVNEVARQNVVNRLDLFGTRAKASLANPQSPTITEAHLAQSTAPSLSNASTASIPLTSAQAGVRRDSLTGSIHSTATSVLDDGIEAPGSDSLENHPIFRSIVSRCREVFNTQVGLITILDNDQQLFLAANGMPDGVDKLPRDVTFCSHAILGEEKGMVVLDTQKDWRFANNLPSTALGARFYAGVPLFARTSGQESAPSVPIGTICVADVVPREEFTEAHRRVLRDFAKQASNAIEQWASQRMAIKLARLHGSLPNASLPDLPKFTSNAVPLPTPPPSAGLPSAANASSASLPARPKTAPSSSFPASPPPSVRHANNTLHARHTSTASNASTAASSSASSIAPPSASYAARPSTALAFAVTTEDPVSSVPRDTQKMFDTAMKMLAKALTLDLVYLAALDLSVLPEPSLRILSARGLPTPAPSFDPNLHLKSLRAREGGLVYRNPRYVAGGNGSFYASGLLIPVIEVRRVGYVLCGYTQQPDREFVQKDLAYFVRFAEQLELSCAKLGRSDQVASLMARSSSAASASSTGSLRGRYE